MSKKTFVAVSVAIATVSIFGAGGLTAVVGSTPSASAATTGTIIHVTQTTLDQKDALTAKADITLGAVASGTLNLSVNDQVTHQKIDGFGAAFTDTSDYVLSTLSATAKAQVMSDLFSRTGSGIGLSFMRVPIASSDFTATPTTAPAPYSYDDNAGVADSTLTNFSIAHDTSYTIPLIVAAQTLNPQMKLYASQWSPPAWMKSSSSMLGNGGPTLLSNMFAPMATYQTKFLQAYAAAGVKVWGITPQNEPGTAANNYPGMIMSPTDEANYIKNNLAPDIAAANLTTKILSDDGADNTWKTTDGSTPGEPAYVNSILGASGASSTTDGVAWHCYFDNWTHMSDTLTAYPSKPQYITECYSSADPTLILQSTASGASGVTLWNLATDENGGPKIGTGCGGCSGLVTVNSTTQAVTYSHTYYTLGQFSKYVLPGATRIGYTDVNDVWAQAYKNTDGSEVLVAVNRTTSDKTFTGTWNSAGSFTYTIPANAITTFYSDPAAPVTPTSASATTLRGTGSNLCIDDGGSATNGVQQTLQNCGARSASQQYALTSANQLTIGGKCLGANQNGTANGTKVVLGDCTSGTGQAWTINSNGSITNQLSTLCLDASAWGTSPGTAVQLWACTGATNQQWTKSTTVQIKGAGSDRCVYDVGNPGNNIQQQLIDCSGTDLNQQYTYTAAAELRIGGKCLGADGNGITNSTRVITWNCNASTSQQWTFNSDGSITNQLSGLCLDAAGWGTGNGTLIQLYKCTAATNQKWSTV